MYELFFEQLHFCKCCKNEFLVSLYHVIAKGAMKYNSSFGDVYEILEQWIKSLIWLKSKISLLSKLRVDSVVLLSNIFIMELRNRVRGYLIWTKKFI